MLRMRYMACSCNSCNEGTGSVEKDAEEAAPIHMEMETITWAAGLQEEQTTLVPSLKTTVVEQENETLSQEQVVRAFGVIADAWTASKPLSMSGQTKKLGRYAPRILSKKLQCSQATITQFLTSWLENECLEVGICDPKNKIKGLRVLEVPGVGV